MVMLDTNMILRYLLNDNIEMAEKAEQYLNEENVYVTIEVIAEVVYVLKGVYSLDKSVIVHVIEEFLDIVKCKEREILKFSLDTFEKYNLDFVDCVLYSYSRVKGIEIATFDKKLLKILSEAK